MAKVTIELVYEDGDITAAVDGKAITIDDAARQLLFRLAFCVSVLNNCRLPYSLTVMT
jgi:hypothetical protein